MTDIKYDGQSRIERGVFLLLYILSYSFARSAPKDTSITYHHSDQQLVIVMSVNSAAKLGARQATLVAEPCNNSKGIISYQIFYSDYKRGCNFHSLYNGKYHLCLAL